MLDYGFVNGCIGLDVEGSTAKAIREIDGGKETLEVTLPAVFAGQKGLVEEAALRIISLHLGLVVDSAELLEDWKDQTK